MMGTSLGAITGSQCAIPQVSNGGFPFVWQGYLIEAGAVSSIHIPQRRHCPSALTLLSSFAP